MAGIYRKLIKSFTKFTGFDGWMIAKAEFKIIKQAGNIYTKDDNTALYMPDIKNSIGMVLNRWKKFCRLTLVVLCICFH